MKYSESIKPISYLKTHTAEIIGKDSLRANRQSAICCVALSCNGTTIASRARLTSDRWAAR